MSAIVGKHKMKCACGWHGDISETKTMQDHGTWGVSRGLYMWWWKRWSCPECEQEIAKITQKSNLNDPLQQFV